MEYFVRFSDNAEEMVALTFGPMKKLIKAYEKEQAKKNRTDDKPLMDEKKPKVEKKSTVIVPSLLHQNHWNLQKKNRIN